MRSIRYTVCAVALTTSLFMPVFAQGTGTNTTSGSTVATSPSAAKATLRDNDGGFNWGWLGLLGLAGLMGLRKQPNTHRTDAARPSMQR